MSCRQGLGLGGARIPGCSVDTVIGPMEVNYPVNKREAGSAVALAVQDVAKALRPRSSANPACCVSSSWKRAGLGESIPLACQDWAGTKAAYRFFSNERVSEEEILRGHFDATRHRFAVSDGPILVLHDTTEFSWRRKRPEAVGLPDGGRPVRCRRGCHRVTPG